jgi:hypothetical protein
MVGVVADDDAEGQPADREDGKLVAGLVDGSADGRVQLAVQAEHGSAVKDRGGVVQLT